MAAAPALAQAPQGGTVAHGSAAISATAAETRVHQSSDRAIIDWRSFDVGRDHRVAFDQPGAHAATLNRVNSGRESTIAGQITAPGTVIIQNNHGVVFSGTARVDVGNLVATSQTVDAARFAADGRLQMRGGEAAGARVENQGTITVREAGLAALVGGRVANSGAIVARRGTVALASGETTTIDLAGDGVVQIAVTGDVGRADAGVENTGLIDAGGGRVVLSAGTASGLLSTVINTSGVIRAASADGAGGTIELVGRGQGTVRVAGNLDASGASRGGAVTVTGQDIRVASTARVTASGRDAGGSVRIGGDRQGQGDLRRAETTTVEAGARIEARASAGTGGSAIVWADRATRFDGAIDVTGPTSGGFAETSAIDLLEIGDAASVNVGPGGHWLIDPVNITINAAQAATIVGTLNGGGNVTVTTDQPGPQLGNLVINSNIVWSGAGNLTLFANNNLNINDNIAVTTSGTGSLFATAGVDTSIAGPVTSSGTGNIRFDTGRNMIVNSNIVASGTGSVTLLASTGNIIASNAGNDRNIEITTATGALRLEATAGSVLLRRLDAASTRNVRVQSNSGDIDIIAGTAIQVRGNLGSSWARVRSETGAITLEAPSIEVVGGSGSNAFAEVVAGQGGSLTMEANRRILVQDGAVGSPARVSALNGADLTMRAPEQVWNGQVRAGDPATGNGGEVAVAGAIIAGVSPIFNLAPGNDFTLEPSVPGPGAGTTASSYTSPVGLRVDTRGAGEITLNAPVVAGQATLVSEERVTLAPGGTVTGTGAGDAVVIAAGRGFDNQAGAGALAAPSGRWLLFLDTFDAMLGTEPTTAEFDLYNRPFDYADPTRADIAGQVATLNVLAGNRIVYAEQPVITVTAETLSKTYGTAVTPGATMDASALRPKDAPLANILVGGTTATSDGAPAGATVGDYTTTPVAGLTDRGAVQGYGLVLVPGTLTVNPAPLTVTADDVARLYGAPNPAFTASFAGFVLGEGPGVLGGALVFDTPATPSSPVGAYAITPSGLTSTNYAITFVPGTLTVNPAPLMVTADDVARLYGAPNPAFTASFAGFVLGEGPGVLGGALVFDTPATPSSPVGAYAITPSGLTSTNYAVSFVPGTLTVNPAPLTVTVDDKSRVYGQTNPALTATLGGIVFASDAAAVEALLGLSTPAVPASPVGAYAITSALTVGQAVQNYTVTVVTPGTLTVNPAPLTVTVDDVARLYGAPNPAFTASFAGFVLGEGPGVLGGALVFDTPATPSSPVGAYAITPSGLTSTNYTITFVPGTLTVNPAPLTVTPNDSTRPEGQPNPPFSVRFDGFVLGEGPDVLGGALVIFTPATPTSPPGFYVITASGLTSTNYQISFGQGTLTVTPALVPPPPPALPTPGVVDAPQPLVRGVPPYTPGDAGFRTTVFEAGPAVADPFRLTYSLGDVIQLAIGQPTLPGGFIPAAGRPAEASPDSPGVCGGPINLGPTPPECLEVSVNETYWSTIGREPR